MKEKVGLIKIEDERGGERKRESGKENEQGREILFSPLLIVSLIKKKLHNDFEDTERLKLIGANASSFEASEAVETRFQ